MRSNDEKVLDCADQKLTVRTGRASHSSGELEDAIQSAN